MIRKFALGATAVASLALAGCSTTGQEAATEFRDSLEFDGPNPLIRDPNMKDLEAKLRTAAFLESEEARADYLIDLFNPFMTSAQVREDLALINQGWPKVAETLYGAVPAADTPCRIEPTEASFWTQDEQEREPLDWIFAGGDCVDGQAHGTARAKTADGRQFVGRFLQGRMIEGAYFDPSTNAIRIGSVGDLGQRVKGMMSSGTWRYFGGIRNGKRNGIGVALTQYTDGIIILHAGEKNKNGSNGFGASQGLYDFGESGKRWGVTIGMYRDGKQQGLGGWTNIADTLFVATYRNGEVDGVGAKYYADSRPLETTRVFRYGGYRNGKRHGGHIVKYAGYEDQEQQNWNNGELVDDGGGLNFGQIFAITAGAVAIGMADIPAPAAIEIGGALTADVIGNTGGGNLSGLTDSYASQQQALSGNASQTVGIQSAAAGAMRKQSYSFTCSSGEDYTINIPYRDASKLGVKKDFTRAMVCNEVDNMAPAQEACRATFGREDCFEQ